MTPTIQELHARKSVRVFTDQPITAEQKHAVLCAAAAAPTAGNQQLYTIIEIDAADRKRKIAELCDHQDFIATAPWVLVFCADAQKWYDTFLEAECLPRKPAVGDLMLAVSDACIAAQNAVVAAESMGIGSCYIGDVMENCEEMREFLQLPAYVFPCAMLVLGYPTEQQKQREKPVRCPIDTIVCHERYERKQGEDLRQMFASKYRYTTFEEWATAFCNRKYNSDFSAEMSRSVAAYLENFES